MNAKQKKTEAARKPDNRIILGQNPAGDSYAKMLLTLKQQAKAANAALAEAETQFIDWLGDYAGVDTELGRITFATSGDGRIDWKAVAVAMQAPETLIENARSEPTRRLGYPVSWRFED